jgi:hypothetical protein
MSAQNNHRQQLVRCTVSNGDSQQSCRYVEHSVYRLWQHKMANKHNLRVTEAQL